MPDYPTNIARLSNQHTNIFILALQEELNLLFKLHQLLIILIVEVPLAAARHIRERSEGRVVGEPEELMEEGNIVLLRDWLSGARRIAAVCRPNLQKRATTLNYLPGLNARRGRGVRGQSGPTLTRQGRKRDVVACRSPRGTTVGTNPSKKKTAQTL